MADELRLSITGTLSKGNLNPLTFGQTLLAATIAGKNFSAGTQTIGLTSEALPLDDVGTIGFVWLKCLDDTNFVTAGVDATNQPIKVIKKFQSFAGWNGAAVHVKANTAPCDVQFVIIEA